MSKNSKNRALCADRRPLRRNTIASRDRCRPMGASQNLALYYNAVYQGVFLLLKIYLLTSFSQVTKWEILDVLGVVALSEKWEENVDNVRGKSSKKMGEIKLNFWKVHQFYIVTFKEFSCSNFNFGSHNIRLWFFPFCNVF